MAHSGDTKGSLLAVGRRRFIVYGAATVAALTTRRGAAPASIEVDLGLVLALDMSESMLADEHQLHVGGYAEAFRSRAVVDAIKSGSIGTIAVTVVKWAKTNRTSQAVDWTIIGDAASSRRFASLIEAVPYTPERGTSIGGAITYGHHLLDDAPFHPLRRVIDISGDGLSYDEPLLARARREALRVGIGINGLPICLDGDLKVARYYRDNVVGGPGSFFVVASGFEAFRQAIRQKLVLEIAGVTPVEATVQLALK